MMLDVLFGGVLELFGGVLELRGGVLERFGCIVALFGCVLERFGGIVGAARVPTAPKRGPGNCPTPTQTNPQLGQG